MQQHHRSSYNHHRHHNLSIGYPLKLQYYDTIPSIHPSKEVHCFSHQYLFRAIRLKPSPTHHREYTYTIKIPCQRLFSWTAQNT
ncbi:unnamed protein product [Tuber melanosporum]|uniref:(Perigord truffle) hypothetical protein n=1 Tax=Tuber melanosporum (strain Mel28) TaxID=656061 RepID=D5G3V8_TUBMM|nr:uncharacterized protein GSTUM_00003822001 [Tuber melanosporum]CAZ79201.1 unnamed protein product [Tuber melanosporum]